MLRSIVPVAAALLSLATAGAARASTVSVVGGELRYAAGAGEWNFVEVFPSSDDPSMVTVYEYEAELEPGLGCAPVPDPESLPELYVTMTCTGATGGALFDLGDKSDELYSSLNVVTTVNAGDGEDYASTWGAKDTLNGDGDDDVLNGRGGEDSLNGGAGDDYLSGDGFSYDFEDASEGPAPGADVLNGGDGDDWLNGGLGADTMAGGDGRDGVSYSERRAPIVVTLDGNLGDGEAGENDVIATDVEGASTGAGNDSVTGAAAGGRFYLGRGDDSLVAGAGDDVIAGGEGVDTLDAGAGADVVYAAEDELEEEKVSADRVTCGDGPDKAELDAVDVAGADCETIERPKPPAPPGGVQPPTPVQALVPPAALAPAQLDLRRLAVRGRRARRTVRLAGHLTPPPGADARVCKGIAIRIELRDDKRVRARRLVLLADDCTFKTTFKRKRRARLTATARFGGSAALLPIASKPLRIRR
jgi:Ca2+-binding RTX toxin-like protein